MVRGEVSSHPGRPREGHSCGMGICWLKAGGSTYSQELWPSINPEQNIILTGVSITCAHCLIQNLRPDGFQKSERWQGHRPCIGDTLAGASKHMKITAGKHVTINTKY